MEGGWGRAGPGRAGPGAGRAVTRRQEEPVPGLRSQSFLSESTGAVSFLPSSLPSSLTPTKPSLIPSGPESFKSKSLKIKAESASSPQLEDRPQNLREACSTWSQRRAWSCTERPQTDFLRLW